jgi:hypothetical protein
MCQRFVFLLAVYLPEWFRLSHRPTAWKDAEILLLRHQIALLERRATARSKLTWADRALFAALLAAVPRACQAAALDGHSCDDLALAPRPGQAPLGGEVPTEQARPTRRHPTITRLVLGMARSNER